MSANRIERMKGEFWMYREAFTPSIWNLIRQLDKEKNNVILKFGGKAISYLDACKYRNEKDLNQDSLKVFKSYAENGGPKGPDNLETRFLHEDVVVGLGLLSMLGTEANISTPVTDSLITIASYLVNKDFHSLKRTKEDFGLINHNFQDIYNFMIIRFHIPRYSNSMKHMQLIVCRIFYPANTSGLACRQIHPNSSVNRQRRYGENC
jgi:opine dehydrogenase